MTKEYWRYFFQGKNITDREAQKFGGLWLLENNCFSLVGVNYLTIRGVGISFDEDGFRNGEVILDYWFGSVFKATSSRYFGQKVLRLVCLRGNSDVNLRVRREMEIYEFQVLPTNSPFWANGIGWSLRKEKAFLTAVSPVIIGKKETNKINWLADIFDQKDDILLPDDKGYLGLSFNGKAVMETEIMDYLKAGDNWLTCCAEKILQEQDIG